MALTPADSVALDSSAMALDKRGRTIGHTGDGLIIVRVLEAIVKNKYAANPGKLAAWTSASHVEKAPKKKPPAS